MYNVYVSVGDSNKKAGWQQLKDPTGGYVFVNYDAATKTITKGKGHTVVKRLK